MNVFELALNSPRGLYGCERAWNRLTELDGVSRAIVLLGPHGAGKGFLLSRFYSSENRRSKFEKGKRIVTAPEAFPTDITTPGGTYLYFFECIKQACRSFGLSAEPWYKEQVETMGSPPEGSTALARSRFKGLLEILRSKGYSVTLVLDDFERFTMPDYIDENDAEAVRRDMDVHKVINALMDTHSPLSFVVATNYDLTKVKYREMEGSVLLHRFAPGAVLLDGLDFDSCRRMCDELLEGDPIALSDGAVTLACDWSGGNPKLLLMALSRLYELKATGELPPAGNSAEYEKRIYHPLALQASDTLESWLKLLDEDEKAVLRALAADRPASGHALAQARLIARGMLTEDPDNPAEARLSCGALADYLLSNPDVLAPGTSPRDDDVRTY